MSELEDLAPGARVEGVVASRAVRVVRIDWHGYEGLTLTWVDDDGATGQNLLYRSDEAGLVVEAGAAKPGEVPVAAALADLGALVVEVLEGGKYRQWLFADRHTDRRSLAGWVSVYHNGKAGLTFLADQPPDEGTFDLRRAVRRVPPPVTGGRFEVIQDDQEGDVVRLVHRFDAALIDGDARRFRALFHQTRSSVGAVWAMDGGVLRGAKAYDNLVRTLVHSGLAVPPTPRNAKGLCHLGSWHWGTVVAPPFSMYMFEADMFIDWWDRRPAFALCHAGHGVNSYGLNLFFADGPVACFVQYGWGGAYSDPHRDAGQIAEGFSRVRSLPRHPEGDDRELSRYLLLYSEFRGAAAIVDLATGELTTDLRDREVGARHGVEEALFDAAAELAG